MGLLSSLLLCQPSPWPVRAAERLEVSIEGVVLPVDVDDLRAWVSSAGTERRELGPWLQLLDDESRSGVVQLLQAPVLTRSSFGEQILRSWAAGPLLDAIGDVVRLIDGDRIGSEVVLGTLEELLKTRARVSTLDLLEALPGQQLRLDLDALVVAASRWRSQLRRHQALMSRLSQHVAVLRSLPQSPSDGDAEFLSLLLPVAHRSRPLELRIWRPATPAADRLWIALMPGLGGSPDHLQWLARHLATAGWPVVLLEHPGSDAAAVQALLDGLESFDGARALQQRQRDLQALLSAQARRRLPVSGERVVLVGHSMGALTALAASGHPPQITMARRCRQALVDLPLTNLSRLLQCELLERGALQSRLSIVRPAAVVGLNSFGSLIWPPGGSATVAPPLLLIGGTLDLITPPLDEQIGLLAAIGQHPASRTVVIEGASHFSPIRVAALPRSQRNDDLFQLGEELVGVNPRHVQRVIASEVVEFLSGLSAAPLPQVDEHWSHGGVRWHRFPVEGAKALMRRYQ